MSSNSSSSRNSPSAIWKHLKLDSEIAHWWISSFPDPEAELDKLADQILAMSTAELGNLVKELAQFPIENSMSWRQYKTFLGASLVAKGLKPMDQILVTDVDDKKLDASIYVSMASAIRRGADPNLLGLTLHVESSGVKLAAELDKMPPQPCAAFCHGT